MLFQVRPLVTIFDNDKTQDEILLLSILLWEYLPEQCLRERERGSEKYMDLNTCFELYQ